MALRRQFTQLVSSLRAELGRTDDAGVRVSDIAALKHQINVAYEQEHQDFDWPHLRTVFDRIPLAAGQRHYDFPSTIDFDRLESVAVWYNSQALPIRRGIGFEQYDVYDPAADERSDPVQRWDVKDTGSTEQIEVWPLPSSNNQGLQFIGSSAWARLVNDSDLCHIDDVLVVLVAAQALDKDAKSIVRRERRIASRRATLRSNGNSIMARRTMGGAGEVKHPKGVTIRVSG